MEVKGEKRGTRKRHEKEVSAGLVPSLQRNPETSLLLRTPEGPGLVGG